MSFKTVLTVMTEARQMPQLEAAIALARREDAHLEVFCLGIDHTQTGYYFVGATAYVFQESIDRAMEAARALESAARARLEAEPLRWSVEAAVTQGGGVSALVGSRARFADLVVQAKPYGEARSPDAETVVEAAMFEGDCPVLIIPESGLPEDFDHRILIGWNQSSEALAAVRRALPLLTRADSVQIVVVDPAASGPERSDPGGGLAQWLTRHGCKTEVAVLARTLPRISDVIARRATESGASMIVIGAYGHSRLREAILGGATRNMLEQATIPVFMAR